MMELFILNIVLVFAAAALGFFFGPDDFGNGSRAFFGLWLGWLIVVLSTFAWIAYVAVHFLSKYW